MRWIFIIITSCLPAFSLADSVTASRTLPAGTVIKATDLALSPDGQPEEVDALVGKQTRITIYAGRPVVVTQARAQRLVARNQIVSLIYSQGQLQIEVNGRAMSAGAAGDMIPVMNLVSRQTVSAVIRPDGTLRIIR